MQPINGKALETQLAYEIRAGIDDTLNLLLKTEPKFILETRYTFPMPFTESSLHISMRHKLPNKSKSNLETKVIMEITTFHLAIISKQVGIVARILEHLTDDETYGETIKDAFSVKTKAVFSGDDVCIYSNVVGSMDGMNCFHLAVKYSPECLYILLQFLRRKGLKALIPVLLEEKDENIRNTALHVAAADPNTSALRLELIGQYY